ncbi:MAG TPA: tetratricopeptide repeat protein [Verrucomicrobiae bacterium]
MPEKTLSEVPRDLRELYQKGTGVLQRQNYDYALAIFHQVLQREPGFFDCRQALRAAQFKKAGNSGGFFKKVLGGASSSPLIAKAQMNLRRDPADALQTAEQVLNSDASSSMAHKIVAEAAMELDLPKTAVLSLEILLKNSPKDYELSMLYGKALAAAGQITKAENVYVELQKAFPLKADINQALKNLSAKKTMKEGGYDALADGSGSYRDILKNKEESIALEQEKREVKSEDLIEKQIQEYERRVLIEPKNLKLLRSLAELNSQKKQYDKALEYAERIRSSDGGADPSLDRLIAEITLRRFDHQLAQLDPNAEDYAQQTSRLQTERTAFQLDECKARAEKYPTDLQIRYELGELYFKAGKISEAIQEFQKAQSNPNRKLQSMAYLGQCFAARGMNDMAARKLQDALKEKLVFDDEKKELIYQLGCVLEKMGKKEEAIEQFKQIYEVDIGYKDVAQKVEKYYSGN